MDSNVISPKEQQSSDSNRHGNENKPHGYERRKAKLVDGDNTLVGSG
jgi:hypothetical protein